jgi:protein-L-isoaspartate(D-aspartate) O-methyltransferase
MKFEIQRNQMVESQLRANLVIDESILDAFSSVKRENYFPENLRSVAYADDNIFINNRRFVIRPFVLAKLIFNLHLGTDKNVLDVGSCNGYSAAILSKLCKKVVCLEEDEETFDYLSSVCKKEKLENVKVIKQSLSSTESIGTQFDNILINGEVNSDPLNLIQYLKIGGKLATVIREDRTSFAVIYIKKEQNHFDKIRIFDASAPLLINYKSKEPVFSF